MGRAGEPMIDDPLRGQSCRPGEVLAEHGAVCTLGERAAGDGPVAEVLAAHHVRGVTAGGTQKASVQSQGGEVIARPNGIHRLEERSLRVAQRPGLSPGSRPQEGETCQKSYENLLFNWHSGESGGGLWGSPPPKGVDRFRSERLFQRAV